MLHISLIVNLMLLLVFMQLLLAFLELLLVCKSLNRIFTGVSHFGKLLSWFEYLLIPLMNLNQMMIWLLIYFRLKLIVLSKFITQNLLNLIQPTIFYQFLLRIYYLICTNSKTALYYLQHISKFKGLKQIQISIHLTFY